MALNILDYTTPAVGLCVASRGVRGGLDFFTTLGEEPVYWTLYVGILPQKSIP